MKKYPLIASLLVIVASIITIASAWHDSPIVDEVLHIGSGYSYIQNQTYRFNPEHPPLAKDLAGLSLSFLDINRSNIDWKQYGDNPQLGQWNLGRALIYSSGTDPLLIVHAAKLPLILFFIFSAVLVFAWTKKTFNSRTALLATFLFSFSPTIIAHSRLVTTDIAALFGVLSATYLFTNYLAEQNTKAFWLASISFGVAMLTKFSTFLLVPFFLILSVLWVWAHHKEFFKNYWGLLVKTILIFATGFILIVGPIYELHIWDYSAIDQKQDAEQILTNYPIPIIKSIVLWTSDKSILRPFSQYGLGLSMVYQRAEGGNSTYFLGKFSNQSFKSYFPIVFSLKEPIPFLILILLALWIGTQKWFREQSSFKEKIKKHFLEVTMLLWVVFYMATSINANLNIGIRHLMPIYGFIFILVAGQIETVFSKETTKKWFKFMVALLCLWYVGEFISVYPYYLTYFNEFAGGPSGGYRYVVDSNLDWGQDLWRLGDYVKQNNIQKINVDYFGWADPAFYLKDSYVWMQGGKYRTLDQFIKENPAGGWLAVSATFLQNASASPDKPYTWLEAYKPTVVIGHSIFVWHINP